MLVVFTNAAAYSSSASATAAATSSSSSSGLQPVKVVAPYGVSGVKSGNACPWLLYSCMKISAGYPEAGLIQSMFSNKLHCNAQLRSQITVPYLAPGSPEPR